MLNNAGTTEARPIAFSCSDLAAKAMYRQRPRVAPDPPAITNMLENSPATA